MVKNRKIIFSGIFILILFLFCFTFFGFNNIVVFADSTIYSDSSKCVFYEGAEILPEDIDGWDGLTCGYDTLSNEGWIELSDEITTIPSAAFKDNNNLASITIPSQITNISTNAFKDSSLMSITFVGNSCAIEENAFEGVNSAFIHLPSGWTGDKPDEISGEFFGGYFTILYSSTNITLDAQSGIGGDTSIVATCGEDMPSITLPTKVGYYFVGYFDEITGGSKYYNHDGTSAQVWGGTELTATLYAQWLRIVEKPQADTTTFIFDGEEKTYFIAPSADYTVSDNTTQTNLGTYVITIELNDKINTVWNDGTSEDFTLNFVIKKPSLIDNTQNVLVDYDGHDYGNLDDIESCIIIVDSQSNKVEPITKNYSFNGENYYLGSLIDWGNINVINAGNYKMYYKYEYEDFETVIGSFTLTIEKIKCQKPQNNTTNFVYNGFEQTYNLATSDYYTITNNKRTNAGTQVVKVELKDKLNTEWIDGTTDDLTYEFIINKAHNSITNLTLENWIYGENPNMPSAMANFGDVEYVYSKTEPVSFVIDELPSEVGKYIVKAYVWGTANYEGAMQEINFEILPAQNKNNVAIILICILVPLAVLITLYLVIYFFMYRNGKLDNRKIKVLFKILPRGHKNLL